MKQTDRRRGELEQAVFRSVYRSRSQKAMRTLAGLVLITKHSVRGLLFSWPVYVLAIAGLFSEGLIRILLWSLAIPGIALSAVILFRGIREEYNFRVADRVLARADLLDLFGKSVA